MNRSKLIKRVIKACSILIGLFCLLTFVSIFLIFLALPSPDKIRKAFAQEKSSGAESAQQSQDSNTGIAANTSTSNKTPEVVNSNLKKGRNETMVRLFYAWTDKAKPLSTVCQTLVKKQNAQIENISLREFVVRLQSSLMNGPADARVESVKSFLKFIVVQPAMQDFIAKIDSDQETTSPAFTKKVDFYFGFFKALKETTERKVQMEHILNQSYLTMMLGRVVEIKPELASDSRLHNYCEQIETLLNQETPVDFELEKQEFYKFLLQANVNPQEIRFDPNYQTHMEFSIGRNGIQSKAGWLDEFFASLKRDPPRR